MNKTRKKVNIWLHNNLDQIIFFSTCFCCLLFYLRVINDFLALIILVEKKFYDTAKFVCIIKNKILSK